MENRFDRHDPSNGSDGSGRPKSHSRLFVGGTMTEGWDRDRVVKVEKGRKVADVQRGVGQESVDGFMEKNPKRVWASLPDETKMQVLASFIKSNIMNQAIGAAAKMPGAVGVPHFN